MCDDADINYMCDICTMEFESRNDLETHINDKYDERRPNLQLKHF